MNRNKRTSYLFYFFFTFLVLFSCSEECISSPKFSKPHGIFDCESITVAIIPSILGAEIHYTIDGSIPTKSSMLYADSLTFTKTTILRAIEIVGDEISTPSTVTYIFTESVLNQTNTPDGYPSHWGQFVFSEDYAPADYEMDPEITNDSEYRSKLIQGLKDIPVLSIVTDKDNLFSDVLDEEKGGIYIYTGTYEGTGNGVGKGWTRPVSVELFGVSSSAIENPQTLDMTVNCGLRLHGGSSRVPEKSPKHSFRLIFKKEYGEGKLDYPLFGENEPSGYNQLILRNHFCLTWYYWLDAMRPNAQYTRDVWVRRMQRKMGYLSDNALYVNLFLNGMYWGLYNIAEKIDDQFCKIHLGGKKSDYDVIKVEDDIVDVIEAAEGDLEKWNEMVTLIGSSNHNSSYFLLQGKDEKGNDLPGIEPLLDIGNFVDYMLLNQMCGNMDWGRHNWFAIRKKGSDSKGFQFICWDSEAIFMGNNDIVLSKKDEDCPTEFFYLMLRNKNFSDRYVKRAAELLAPNGLLGPKSVVEVWDSLYYTIQNAVYLESARWGDYRKDVHQYEEKGHLYTVDNYYLQERERLMTDYFPNRSQTVLESIVSYVTDLTGRDYKTSISHIQTDRKGSEFYDLLGKKVTKPNKGIYIQEKKKIYKK